MIEGACHILQNPLLTTMPTSQAPVHQPTNYT